MTTRKFYIENGQGVRRSLDNTNNISFVNPSGLGASLGHSFADLKKGFFVNTSDDAEDQMSITGDLVFTGANPYQDYLEFSNWLMTQDALYFVYRPYGALEFMRKVDMRFMTKTERNDVGWLSVPVSFPVLTPWHTRTPMRMTVEPEAGNVIRCDVSVCDDAIFPNSSHGGAGVTVNAAGHIPAAFELKYTGAISNPCIRLVAEDGTVIGRCLIATSLSAGEQLSVCTKYNDAYVKKQSIGGREIDLLDEVDLATDPFPRLPVGVPCTVELKADNEISGVAELSVFSYYRTV